MRPILTTNDLPLAELSAMRLDGEIVAVDQCFAPFDDFPSPEQRASALALNRGERLIAERHSAAWVWGALDHPPTPHEFCVAHNARVTRRPVPHLTVREVVLAEGDVIEIGGVAVTSPQRTIADLVRFSDHWGQRDGIIVSRLLTAGGLTVAQALRELDRHKLPHKRRATERLRASADVQQILPSRS